MIFIIISSALLLLLGFGLGRIKNAQKLAEIRSEIDKLVTGAEKDIVAVVAKVRAKL